MIGMMPYAVIAKCVAEMMIAKEQANRDKLRRRSEDGNSDVIDVEAREVPDALLLEDVRPSDAQA